MERAEPGIWSRPMGLGDLLDETFRLYRRHWWSFAQAMAVPIVLSTVLTVVTYSPPRLPEDIVAATQGRTFLEYLLSAVDAGLPDPVTWLLWPFQSMFLLFGEAAVVQMANGALRGEPLSVRAAYRSSLPRMVRLIWSTSLAFLTSSLLAATVIGIPLAIYRGIGWWLVSQVVVLEGLSGRSALRRSSGLVRGYRWRTLGIGMAAGMILSVLLTSPLMLVVWIGALVPALPGAGSDGAWVQFLMNALVGAILGAVFNAIPPVAMTLLYYDLRVRKDAYDLDRRIAVMSDDRPAGELAP